MNKYSFIAEASEPQKGRSRMESWWDSQRGGSRITWGILALALSVRAMTTWSLLPSMDECYTFLDFQIIQLLGFTTESILGMLDGPVFVLFAYAASLGPLDEVTSVRLLSVFSSTIAIFWLYESIRVLANRKIATWTIFIVAISPFFVYLGREGRPYGLSFFFGMLFVRYYLYSTESQWFKRAIILGILASLTVGVQFYNGLFIASFYLIVFTGHTIRRNTKRLAADFAGSLIGFVLVMPYIFIAYKHAQRFKDMNYWLPAGLNFINVAVEQVYYFGFFGSEHFTWLYLFLFCLLFIPFILLFAVEKSRAGSPLLLLLGWLPLLLVSVLSLLAGKDLLYFARGFLCSAPFLIAGWLFSWDALSHRWPIISKFSLSLFVVFFLIGVVLVLPGTNSLFRYSERSNFKKIASQIAAIEEDIDNILVHHWLYAPVLNHYYKGQGKLIGAGMRFGPNAEPHVPKIALEDAIAIPSTETILLFNTHFAEQYIDPQRIVRSYLDRTRPRLLTQ